MASPMIPATLQKTPASPAPWSSATEAARRECTPTSSAWQPGNIRTLRRRQARQVAGRPSNDPLPLLLALPPGTRWERRCRFARHPARPQLVELRYLPLAALRLARLVVFARQSWRRRRRVSASFIDCSTCLLSERQTRTCRMHAGRKKNHEFGDTIPQRGQ
jgi:hypothetical protein